jgi:hypothetical protein
MPARLDVLNYTVDQQPIYTYINMAKLWPQTNFLMSLGPYPKPAVVVPLTKSENESNNSPEEDEAWGQLEQTVAILSTRFIDWFWFKVDPQCRFASTYGKCTWFTLKIL